MASTPAAALAGRVAEFKARGGRLLGITGAPGSGKSTVAEGLVAATPGACLLPMDGFHYADEELARLGRSRRKGAPDTFDVDGFIATLRRVHEGRHDVLVPRFHRHLEAAMAGAIRIPAGAPLVVVEGNYLLLDSGGWEGVRPLLDECWLLRPDDAVRRQRLVARHQQHGRSADDAEHWVATVDEPNARLIASHAAGADFVVDPG